MEILFDTHKRLPQLILFSCDKRVSKPLADLKEEKA